MKKIATYLSFFVLCCLPYVQAQKSISANQVKILVEKNAAKLGFTVSDLQNYRVEKAFHDKRADVIMAHLKQTYNGTDIYNAVTTLAFKNDNLVATQSSWIKDIESKTKGITKKSSLLPSKALQVALAGLNVENPQSVYNLIRKSDDGQEFEYEKMGIALNNIIVRQVWAQDEVTNKLNLTWQVSLITLKDNGSWDIKVDAVTGKVIGKRNLTSYCNWGPPHTHNGKDGLIKNFNTINNKSVGMPETYNYMADLKNTNSATYRVIPYPFEDPNHTSHALDINPWLRNGDPEASPLKWHSDNTADYETTRGNNVYAYEDLAGNNSVGFTPPTSTALPNLTFDFTPDFALDPVEYIFNQAFAITNLFYWNNLIHDLTYNYGFDEVAEFSGVQFWKKVVKKTIL